MAADTEALVSRSEAAALFHNFHNLHAIVLAVSGGPDSTALMLLAARWRKSLARGPKLIAVTVDHGLRPEARDEAKAVGALARKLGIAHRTVRWTGKKPSTGLQEAARAARYRLLAQAAKSAAAPVIVTAHTLDDQAETVLLRLARGSGLTGLAAMRVKSRVPGAEEVGLVRPFLAIPKSRLIATLAAEKVPFAHDPSNTDPRFTRARLRGLMPKLAEEGLDSSRLALVATRLRRAEEALSGLAEEMYGALASQSEDEVSFPADILSILPDEFSLRLLSRAITALGDEGPAELGKLESLHSGLKAAFEAKASVRQTLAGALVTLHREALTVGRAPPRRSHRLTKRRTGRRSGRKTR